MNEDKSPNTSMTMKTMEINLDAELNREGSNQFFTPSAEGGRTFIFRKNVEEILF